MAQLFGASGLQPGPGVTGLADRMGGLQRRPSQAPPTVWAEGGTTLGCLTTGERGGLFGGDTGGGPVWILDGEIRGLSAAARAVPGVDPEAPATAIGRLYSRFGARFPEHIEGSFAIALHDRQRAKLVLATDRCSTRTLYWTGAGRRLLFASELKALLADPDVPRRLDGTALSQAFAFSRILGQRTLLAGIRRLPPGAVLEHDFGRPAAGPHFYWRPQQPILERRPLTADRLEAIVEAFRQAVLPGPEDHQAGLSLSGGLDSRTIAAVLRAASPAAVACTTGLAGCSDERLGRRIASQVGLRHVFYALTREQVDAYPQALREAIHAADGMILVGGFPGTLTRRFCEEWKIDTLFRGHGGENARLGEAWPFQVTPAARGLQTPGQLLDHLRRSLTMAPTEGQWSALFPDPDLGISLAAAQSSLAEVLEPLGDLSPAEALAVLYLQENDGSTVPLTRNILRGCAELRLPYLDSRYLELVLATNVADRVGSTIHQAIVRRHAPALLRVPNSNTGASLDASPLRLYLTDKLNTVLRRLRVPGYRHYHYMELWIARSLAAQMRDIVLDRRTLTRGLFSQARVEQLADQAAGDPSRSRLLNLVVNLEIWCRLFLDGKELAA